MKIVVAGQGAFGVKHIEAIQKISGITIASLAGGSPDSTAEVARKYGIEDAGGKQPPSYRDMFNVAPHVQYPRVIR